jgi:anti-sigma factor RsiW
MTNEPTPSAEPVAARAWDGLTCREVIEFILAYLDDELDATTRRELDRHLAVCPSCVAYLAGYRSTIRLARGAAAEPADVPDELVAAIVASRPQP